MTFLRMIPKLIVTLVAVCAPSLATVNVSGGDPPFEEGTISQDVCGNTATLDCSSNVSGLVCEDGSRWAAAPDQPQTYKKADTVLVCNDPGDFPNNGLSCSGSGYRAFYLQECEALYPPSP